MRVRLTREGRAGAGRTGWDRSQRENKQAETQSRSWNFFKYGSQEEKHIKLRDENRTASPPELFLRLNGPKASPVMGLPESGI